MPFSCILAEDLASGGMEHIMRMEVGGEFRARRSQTGFEIRIHQRDWLSFMLIGADGVRTEKREHGDSRELFQCAGKGGTDAASLGNCTARPATCNQIGTSVPDAAPLMSPSRQAGR